MIQNPLSTLSNPSLHVPGYKNGADFLNFVIFNPQNISPDLIS